MSFLQELSEIRKSFLPWIILLFCLTFFLFSFGIKSTEINGLSIYYPSPSFNSLSSYFLKRSIQDLLTKQIKIVTLNPLDAFIALMVVSFLLAFIVSFPFFLSRLIRYLTPALHLKEKRAFFKVLIPSSVLFVLGCLFAYFLLIPLTFRTLYTFAFVIGAEPLFYITKFIGLVLALMIGTGIIFLLPIFMILLSWFGLVEGNFWQRNWRYAILLFFVFSAIITPDGSGITMILLSLPLCGLYFLGVGLTRQRSQK